MIRFCLFAVLVFLLPGADALAQQVKLTLAAPISNHMVLQHDQTSAIWGTAPAGETVAAELGGKKYQTTADQKGAWQLELDAMPVSADPQSLTIECGDQSIVVKDILIGEVWMCSGQSNMAWTMGRLKDPGIKTADMPNVRFFNTELTTALTPQTNCRGKWQIVSPDATGQCSAVAFYFGKKLQQELKVPIGLIVTAWGGKPVESFTSMPKVKQVDLAKALVTEWENKAAKFDPQKSKSEYEKALKDWKAKVEKIKAKSKATSKDAKPKLPRKPRARIQPELDSNYPGSIYNARIAPWIRYSIAGAIWYQGESNQYRAAQYEPLMEALILDWREKWNHEFPFYMVQLANYYPANDQPGVPDAWAELQDVQTKVAQKMNRCGLAVINDIGNPKNIHPRNKQDVGLRLASLALKEVYQKEIPVHASPFYKSHQINGSSVVVEFDNVGAGLKSRDGQPLQRFEIAGQDRNWHWAEAQISDDGKTVAVSSEEVASPIAVRYAWASNPQGANLVNSAGLPASLFRTDDWPMTTASTLTQAQSSTCREARTASVRLRNAGYSPLFNGFNLSGWRNPYDRGQAKIVGNEIHLTADKKFFLVTEKEYSDFKFVGEVKLPEGKANSGFMFRCHVEPNKVFGYQAEVDGSDRGWSGGLYDEGRRQWIWPSNEGRSQPEFLKHEEESKAFFADPKVKNALRRNGWNQYEILCQGDQITITVNKVVTTKIRDSLDASGFIGIQHHGEQGQTYKFRNLYIKELK